jgi:hypothetical protein
MLWKTAISPLFSSLVNPWGATKNLCAAAFVTGPNPRGESIGIPCLSRAIQYSAFSPFAGIEVGMPGVPA